MRSLTATGMPASGPSCAPRRRLSSIARALRRAAAGNSPVMAPIVGLSCAIRARHSSVSSRAEMRPCASASAASRKVANGRSGAGLAACAPPEGCAASISGELAAGDDWIDLAEILDDLPRSVLPCPAENAVASHMIVEGGEVDVALRRLELHLAHHGNHLLDTGGPRLGDGQRIEPDGIIGCLADRVDRLVGAELPAIGGDECLVLGIVQRHEVGLIG